MLNLSFLQRRKILDGVLTRMGLAQPARSPVVYEGHVQLELRGPDGEVKQRAEAWNAAVSYGMSRLADFIATGTAAGSTWMNHLAIGTGTTAPTSNDASLVASTGSVAANKIAQGARTARYTASFNSDNPAGSATIAEVGLFQTNTFSASMGARATLSPTVTKGASDTLSVSYDVIVQGT